MGSTDRSGARFGQAEVPDLALANQILDRSGYILDRHVRVDTVLVEQIDAFDVEPLQGAFRDFADVLRATVHRTPSGLSGECGHEAEFGGDHDLSAKGRERLAQKLFVRIRAIYLGRIEEGDAGFIRAANQGDHLLL